MSDPVISVVTATWNSASVIAETLESVRTQTFADFEMIVIDDCSSDGTMALLEAWPDKRVRAIRAETNGGVVRARNRAVAEARGRYIVGLDHDDLCRPERFARQLAYMERHPQTGVLGTSAANYREGKVLPSSWVPMTTPSLVEWLLWIENPLVWSSVMIRRDALPAGEPFQRLERIYAEDFDLYHRVAAKWRIARLDEELLLYRRIPGQASSRHARAMTDASAAVLADTHAALFGDEAHARAELLVTHVMRQQAVPDRATLALLGDTIGRLQTHFLQTRRPDKDSGKLIRWETARRWAAIGRRAVRGGVIDLADLVTVRPDHLGLGHAGLEELFVSGAVGGMRRLARRYGRKGSEAA